MEEPESRPSLSLVVLCYRSEEFAPVFAQRAIDALEGAGIASYELILVANHVEGSDDPTPGIVTEFAAKHPRVRCSTQVKKGWMGWDMRSGLEMARGDYIGVIDGDGQMPVSDVAALYRLIETGSYGLVKTYRITRGDAFSRKLISTVYNTCFRILFPGLHSRDINSKPKLMTREFYELTDLRSDGWFVDAEIMIEARRHKIRLGEVPTHFVGLTGRRSFVGLAAIFEFIRELIVYRLREFGR
jgi:glycosyltransferase involved in cell wall biosynthesis